MTTATPTQRLATIELGEDVVAFIDRERQAGVSWRLIARHLYEASEHRIDVTHETLRSWYSEAVA